MGEKQGRQPGQCSGCMCPASSHLSRKQTNKQTKTNKTDCADETVVQWRWYMIRCPCPSCKKKTSESIDAPSSPSFFVGHPIPSTLPCVENPIAFAFRHPFCTPSILPPAFGTRSMLFHDPWLFCLHLTPLISDHVCPSQMDPSCPWIWAKKRTRRGSIPSLPHPALTCRF